MNDEIILPALTQELINKLDKLFPDKCPLLTDDDRVVWYKAGQRKVVEFLQQTYDDQLEQDIVTKQVQK